MIVDSIKKLVDGIDLQPQEAQQAMRDIMEGQATDSQIGSFLTALRMKGETADEVFGLASIMRKKASLVDVDGDLLDTCGTGGDLSGTFNISTATAFIAAGAGARVAKHGNRSISSKCGSADVLEALGINISLSPEQLKDCLNKTGIAFLFAQSLHPAMKYVATARRELGIRTVFNILGPLSNPAGAKYQLLGVFSPDLTELMANALKRLGSKKAFVVHGLSGLDEIAIDTETRVSELSDGEVKTYNIDPTQFGLALGRKADLAGHDAIGNADLMVKLLSGDIHDSLVDAVVLNSAFALVACERVKTIEEGVSMARESLESKAALNKLKELIDFSKGL